MLKRQKSRSMVSTLKKQSHLHAHIQWKGHQDEFLVFTLESLYLKCPCLLQMKSYKNADMNIIYIKKIQQNCMCKIRIFKSTPAHCALTELQKHGNNLRKVQAKTGERITSQCLAYCTVQSQSENGPEWVKLVE